MIEEIVKKLRCYRYKFNSEAELQTGLHAVLELITETIPEYRLDENDRPDFFLPAYGIAIEVKTKGSPKALLEQVMRYASHGEVKQILVITARIQLAALPAKVNGKPLCTLALTGSVL